MMMKFLFSLTLLFSTSANAGWFSNFCERHLVAADPYQYEHLTVDQLVSVYWRFRQTGHHSVVLLDEMKRRLDEGLSIDDREILTKTLANER